MENNTQNWGQPENKEAPKWAKGIVIVIGILFLIGAGLELVHGNPAKADEKTLQQSVEMAQADYEFSQSATQAAMTQACDSWKALALAKADLAAEMKISTNIDGNAVKAVNCTSAGQLVPVSFL